MTTYTTLKLKQDNDVLEVVLNRKNGTNPINLTMIKELIALADWLREQQEIRFVVFTNDSKFFSVGADLMELNDSLEEQNAADEMRKMQIIGQEMMRKLENIEQITIAAMNGSVYGGGAAIALTTDFRLMTESSVLNLPETNVGLFLTWGCTPRLVKSIGAVKAKEIIMLCEDVDAAECYRVGLINKVVSEDAMDSEVNKLIGKLRTKGPLSIRLTKKIVNSSVAPHFGDILINEPELVERVTVSGEPTERVVNFVKSKKK